jgi:hypothetical protein
MTIETMFKNYSVRDRIDFQGQIIGCLLIDETRLISVDSLVEWLGVGLHAQLGILGGKPTVEIYPVKFDDGMVRAIHFIDVTDMSKWFGKILDSERSKRTREEMMEFVNGLEEAVGEFYHNQLRPPTKPEEWRTAAQAAEASKRRGEAVRTDRGLYGV